MVESVVEGVVESVAEGVVKSVVILVVELAAGSVVGSIVEMAVDIVELMRKFKFRRLLLFERFGTCRVLRANKCQCFLLLLGLGSTYLRWDQL